MIWTVVPSYIDRVGWRAVGAFPRLTFRPSESMTLKNAPARSLNDLSVQARAVDANNLLQNIGLAALGD
jgi:hypothetical protein